MSQQHLFVMDPFEKLNLELDSSLRMAYALTAKGCQTFFTTQQRLSWNIKNPYAHTSAAEIVFTDAPDSAALTSFEQRGLDEFSAIHMRKDPPFDLEYIASSWLLDAVPPSTRVINHPAALRGLNEKLSIFHFNQYVDQALLSSDPIELFDFICSDCDGQAIIKPLDLFGGRGVSKIAVGHGAQPSAGEHTGDNMSKKQALNFLTAETKNGTIKRLVQPFNGAIYKGEVRAFAAGGEPLSYCLKTPVGGFLANTGSGAILSSYTPPQELDDMVRDVSSQLLKQGVFIAGYDIIGSFISEINITSPRLLLPSDVNEKPYYEKLAEMFINYCK